MDGTLYPIQGRTPLVAYKGGEKNGSTVLPRTRFNHDHMVRLCSHHQFVECYENHGDQPCADGCGYVDDVGDNFYWGGIEKDCGTPMTELSYTAKHQFTVIY